VKKFGLTLVVLLVLVVAVGGWGIGKYNALVKENEGVNGQWAQVENQLQRRNDLIPNLVSTVKGYAAHEEKVFADIADARAKLAGAGSIDEKAAAAGELQGALSRLLVVVENYPTLKADAQFQALMDELTGTENRLAVERMRFNELVRDFDTKIKQFPTSLFASITGFKARAYFEVAPGAQGVPQVDFTK
jgi:LemA protein